MSELEPFEGIIAMPLIELASLHCSRRSYSNEASRLDSIKRGGGLRRCSCYLEIKFFPHGFFPRFAEPFRYEMVWK